MLRITTAYGDNGFSIRPKTGKICTKNTYNRGKNYTGG
jgi:hypothetical protein